MLVNPSPDDWLMYSRTYDAQRFSPLEFVNRRNVGQLKRRGRRSCGTGKHESIPIVYSGVMYVIQPGARCAALDATNGALIWEYKRDTTLRVADEDARDLPRHGLLHRARRLHRRARRARPARCGGRRRPTAA